MLGESDRSSGSLSRQTTMLTPCVSFSWARSLSRSRCTAQRSGGRGTRREPTFHAQPSRPFFTILPGAWQSPIAPGGSICQSTPGTTNDAPAPSWPSLSPLRTQLTRIGLSDVTSPVCIPPNQGVDTLACGNLARKPIFAGLRINTSTATSGLLRVHAASPTLVHLQRSGSAHRQYMVLP